MKAEELAQAFANGLVEPGSIEMKLWDRLFITKIKAYPCNFIKGPGDEYYAAVSSYGQSVNSYLKVEGDVELVGMNPDVKIDSKQFQFALNHGLASLGKTKLVVHINSGTEVCGVLTAVYFGNESCDIHLAKDTLVTLRFDGPKRPGDACIQVLSTPSAPAYAPGTCPKCGDRGEWRCMALVCLNGHGVFAG